MEMDNSRSINSGQHHNQEAEITLAISSLQGQAHIQTNATSSNKPLMLENNEEARQKYLNRCVPLYIAALKGDWEKAESIINDEDNSILRLSITRECQTVLHVAAGTKYVHFVEKLVRMMDEDDLELQDSKGNTALCFAIATGTVQVAEILISKNSRLAKIRGGGGTTPLYMAALFGHMEMAWYLYPQTEDLSEMDRADIFFVSIKTGLYDLALKMLEDDRKLAIARNEIDNKTALHLLAETPSAFSNQSSGGLSELVDSYWNFRCQKDLKQHKAFQLLRCSWKYVLNQLDDKGVKKLIGNPSELLFIATKFGNFEFLVELINFYPDLVWEVSPQNWTIIHVAVLYRHANIFNLIHEIGSIKNIITTYEDTDGNNILHLAAKLPPKERLNILSGAALKMQQELLWFENVKKIVHPLYIKKENNDGKTPEELFTIEHEDLRRHGEIWMKTTANSCMIVSTIITTVVFAAAFTLPGGNDNKGTPNNVDNISFLVFVLSDGAALFSSIIAMLMFLSILTSDFTQYDFARSLPIKLMLGLTSLFLSITSMMVGFSFTFNIAYHNGLQWVPTLISIFAIIPIILFVKLQFPLLFDTFTKTCFSGRLFQSNGHMWY